MSQVKHSICKDIWKGKFIDLGSLLPSVTTTAPTQYMLQLDDHSNVSITPSSKPRRITSIETWTTAFLRFVAIYTTKFPHETPRLMKYAEIVRELAVRKSNFLFYDCQFRMLRESFPFPWDQLHSEL